MTVREYCAILLTRNIWKYNVSLNIYFTHWSINGSVFSQIVCSTRSNIAIAETNKNAIQTNVLLINVSYCTRDQ